MKINKLFVTILALGISFMTAQAQDNYKVGVSDSRMLRQGELMSVDFTLDLSELKVVSNRALLITPRIVGPKDTLVLPSVGVYGRTRYYQYTRARQGMISGEGEQSFRVSEKPETLPYSEVVAYAPWMGNARLELLYGEYGCCQNILAQNAIGLAQYSEPALPEPYCPEFLYVRPAAEAVKHRALSGEAYIDFPVNRTAIQENYRNNAEELAKIRRTIDSVREDGDISLNSISIKGYASPEGKYANNLRLAKGRTESLKAYVNGLYHFGNDFIGTESVPENWEGLRSFVEASQLANKKAILEVIDGSLEPDAKEKALATQFPEDYNIIKENCYPALRRTDYKIDYQVRHYADAEEIRSIIDTRPQNLSLEEFYIAAQGLDAGSEEFNDIFETAVRMFPHDEAANLNAGVSALQCGDLKRAARYLDRAGESAEAVYARGVLAALQQDYTKADELFCQVSEILPQAAEARKQLEKYINK